MEHHQLGPKLPISAWLCYLLRGFPPGILKPTPQSKAGVGWPDRFLTLCTLSHVVGKVGTITPPSCGL